MEKWLAVWQCGQRKLPELHLLILPSSQNYPNKLTFKFFFVASSFCTWFLTPFIKLDFNLSQTTPHQETCAAAIFSHLLR